MRQSRFSEDQIVAILKEGNNKRRDVKLAAILNKYGISHGTYYKWRKWLTNSGSSNAVEIKRVKELEMSNKQLKELLAKVCYEKQILQDAIEGKL